MPYYSKHKSFCQPLFKNFHKTFINLVVFLLTEIIIYGYNAEVNIFGTNGGFLARMAKSPVDTRSSF